MQINARYTKNPIKGSVKPLIGGKKVVDTSGALMCFLRNGKLYDLNHVCFASCKRVASNQIGLYGAFATDGKYLYDKRVLVGKVQRDYSFLIIFALVLLLLTSAISLLVVTHERKEPIIPEFTVVDADGEWGATGSLNVFGNGKICPGEKGTYMFMVNNPNAADINCKIKFKFRYGNGESLPPVSYTIFSEGKKLTLAEVENGLEVSGVVINEKSSRSFMLEWKWEFDGGDDGKDTIAGVLGSKYDILIEIIAEEA